MKLLSDAKTVQQHVIDNETVRELWKDGQFEVDEFSRTWVDNLCRDWLTMYEALDMLQRQSDTQANNVRELMSAMQGRADEIKRLRSILTPDALKLLAFAEGMHLRVVEHRGPADGRYVDLIDECDDVVYDESMGSGIDGFYVALARLKGVVG